MRQEFGDVRADMRKQFAGFEKRFDSFEARIDSFERRVETRFGDIDRHIAYLTSEIVNAMKLFGIVGETINDIHHQMADIQRSVQEYGERVGRLTTETIRMRTAMSSVIPPSIVS